MKSMYDMIYEIDNNFQGFSFGEIKGVSIIGSPCSDAEEHPVQYSATSTIRRGDDDAFCGIGWTPSEAVRNLLKIMNDWKNKK